MCTVMNHILYSTEQENMELQVTYCKKYGYRLIILRTFSQQGARNDNQNFRAIWRNSVDTDDFILQIFIHTVNS